MRAPPTCSQCCSGMHSRGTPPLPAAVGPGLLQCLKALPLPRLLPPLPPTPTLHRPLQKKKKRPSVALTDLASLTASLNEAAAGLEGCGPQRRQFGRSVGTQRGRERVAAVEMQRLQQVLQHPQFVANPLAAVTSHLAATLPAAPPPPSTQAAKDPAQLRREKKKRRKERAAAGRAMADD